TNSNITNVWLGSLQMDSKGNMWIGTHEYQDLNSGKFIEGGIMRFNGDSFSHYTYSLTGLPLYAAKALKFDKNDNLWAALGEYGLLRLNTNDSTYLYFNETNSPLPSNFIWEDRKSVV